MSVLYLRSHRRCARLMRYGQLLRSGPRINSATPAVVTDPVMPPMRHRMVVNIVDSRGIHVRHRAIIVKPAVIPIGAIIAAARVSIAVIDAAIVADVRTPIAGMPEISTVIVAPPWRRPERTYPRRQHPRAGNPVIARVGVIPVTRCPNVIVAGGWRLRVIGKRRRRFGGLHRLFVRGVLIVIGRIIAGGRRITLSGWGHRRRLRWLRSVLRSVLARRSEISIGRVSVRNIRRLGCGNRILRGLRLRFGASH